MLPSILILGCLLSVDPSGNDALKTKVSSLVHKLDADTEKERTDAEEDLLKLGPAALDDLPAVDAQATDYQSIAIARVRRSLQTIQAAGSIKAATVTLHGRLKLSKVLAEIEKQTGNAIAAGQPADGSGPDPEIEVQFDKTPFWTALDSTLDQAQLSIYPYGQPHTLKIVPRGPNDLPRSGRAVLAGPLRIEPVTVLAKRALRSSLPATLQVSLEVAWEPRLQPIGIRERMADLKALDSTGGSLAPDEPGAVKEAFPASGSSAAEMGLSLLMPARPPEEIASLSGSLQVMMMGKSEVFRFGELLKGKQEKRIAAATVALDEFRKNGASWEVHMRLRFDDAGDALESHRNWALQNEAYLEDSHGKPIHYDTMEQTLRTKNEIGVNYVFNLTELPKNLTFVYKTPGMILTQDFKYEARRIKMP